MAIEHETLPAERVEAGAARIAAMKLSENQPQQSTAPLNPPAQQQPAADPPPATDAGKKGRTTVAKLLQGYREKEAEITPNIQKMESIIFSYQTKVEELKAKREFLRELIAEIEAD